MSVLLDEDNVLVEGRTPQLNLAEGGQQGAMTAPHQWTSSAAYVRQKVIAVLLSHPAAMQYLTDAQAQIAALKSLIEVMPLRIEGLNSTVTWEFAEAPVGNAGEMMESVINATRERSVPAFAWNEKYGMAISRYFTELGRLLQMDPELNVPGIVAEPGYIQAGRPPILPEQQSMTVLFIEPDEAMSRVTNSWLCTNMMMKTGGEIIGRREMQGANEVPEVSIEFTALTMTGTAVTRQAQEYLDSLALADLRPTDLRPFTEGVSPDVAAAEEGFQSKISSVVEEL